MAQDRRRWERGYIQYIAVSLCHSFPLILLCFRRSSVGNSPPGIPICSSMCPPLAAGDVCSGAWRTPCSDLSASSAAAHRFCSLLLSLPDVFFTFSYTHFPRGVTSMAAGLSCALRWGHWSMGWPLTPSHRGHPCHAPLPTACQVNPMHFSKSCFLPWTAQRDQD